MKNCKYCGKELPQETKGNFCSKLCKIEQSNITRKQTMLTKYGVENTSQLKEVKEKSQAKRKQTLLENFGVENISQLQSVKDKKLKTLQERYGKQYTNNSQIPELKEKMRESNRRAQLSLEVKEKIAQTNLERYGIECVFQSEEIKSKIKRATKDRFGVSNISQRNIKNYKDWTNLENFLKDNDKKYNCYELAAYFNCLVVWVRRIAIKKRLTEYIRDFWSLSSPENDFKQLLDRAGFQLDVDYILHDRQQIKPLELDFYFPKLKLAVEISPTHTHNHYALDDKLYHYKKFKQCKDKGIELITVFDWHPLEKIVDFIVSKVNSSKLYARKCKVEIRPYKKDLKLFIEENHILGAPREYKNHIAVCLYFQDSLVGCGVFRQQSNQWELRRLAFKDGITVVGGASKIVKSFFDNFANVNEVFTFSDNDLGTGKVYKTIGFQLIEENRGQLQYYHYETNHKISNLSLVKQGADRLLASLEDYQPIGISDELPSNQEIVEMYGYLPFYDSGYSKWVLKRSRKVNGKKHLLNKIALKNFIYF